MHMPKGALVCFGFAALMFASGCANMPQRDPVEVYVVGVEPLEGEGLELRMLIKVRVQNPNDTPIEYDGVAVSMDVQGKTFASGVSNAAGTVPRFGEAVIDVPVSVSAFRMARGAADIFKSNPDSIEYALKGKLAGPLFKSVRFNSKGSVSLPKGVYGTGERD
jgi:LEA14-like dessication related protein